ncbi:MAG TPA: serine hydrolase [Mycobacteriales bacterium]|nr:serine hydrolase [Mycobacteriales bacterium]
MRSPGAALIAWTLVAAFGAASPAPATGTSLHEAVARYLATRQGSVTVTVYDAVRGREWSWRQAGRGYTASIVKVDILAALLHRTASLTTDQRRLAKVMIEESDNEAASVLYRQIGGAPGLDRFNAKAGLTQTVASTSWGLTRTSAHDQVVLLRLIANPTRLLTAADRRYELHLMRSVTAGQCWGIAPCVPEGVSVALKNGWVPLSSVHGGGWQVNSIAYVSGDGRRYFIAVLSHETTFSYGVETIQGVSEIIWPYMSVAG